MAARDDPSTLVNATLALAYFGEDIGTMITLIDHALTLNPSYARGWYVSGILRWFAGQTDTAISVRDVGPGVPEMLLPRLTEPFFRADAARDANTGGVGLGLSIVSKIVDEHHGTIRLENSDGKGACFVIFFLEEEEVRLRAPSS